MGKGEVVACIEILGGAGRVKSFMQTSKGDICQDGLWVGEYPRQAGGFSSAARDTDSSR